MEICVQRAETGAFRDSSGTEPESAAASMRTIPISSFALDMQTSQDAPMAESSEGETASGDTRTAAAHGDYFSTKSPSPNPDQRPPLHTSSPLDALALACAARASAPSDDKAPLSPASAPSLPSVVPPGEVVRELSDDDVLCGRGGLTNHHPGNVRFRRLVRSRRESYLQASKRDKAGVARDVVDAIRRRGVAGGAPGGRFLKRDPKNPGVWVEIGDRKAREKTSQALREGAPELREELSHQQKKKAASVGRHSPPMAATVPSSSHHSHGPHFSGTHPIENSEVGKRGIEPTTPTHQAAHQGRFFGAPPPPIYSVPAITQFEAQDLASQVPAPSLLPRARVVSADDSVHGGAGGRGPSPPGTAALPIHDYSVHECQGTTPTTSGTPGSNVITADRCPALPPPPLTTPTLVMSPGAAAFAGRSEAAAAAAAPQFPNMPGPPLCGGIKRKITDGGADGAARSPRGPRLRVFKERMMELC